MTFMAPTKSQPLITIVEFAFGANPDASLSGVTWTDVSARVRGAVTITKGRPSQTGDADPTKISFTLDNHDGWFTAENPMSQYWPYVVQNVPCRVSRTWAGAAGVYERATAFVIGWPIQTNAGVLDVTVSIQAAGRLRRLRNSNKTVTSAMTRAISTTSPIAWWACEDGTQATQAASGLPGGRPMTVDGGTISFAAVAGPPGTANLPDTTGSGQLVGFIPVTTSTSYRIEFAAKFPSIAPGAISPAATVLPAGGLTNGIETWVFGANANGEGGAYIRWSGDAGTSTDFRATNVNLDDGEQHHIRLDFANSGGSMQVNITIDNVAVGGSFPWTPSRDWTVPTRFIGAPHTFQSKLASIGEITVWAPYTSSVDTFAAFGGYANELADARAARMAAQEGVSLIVISGTVPAQMMGPQIAGTFNANLEDCVDVDNAVLHDGGPLGALVYVSGSALYNAPTALTLDYNRNQISDDDAGAFPGAFDDEYLANQWDLSKTGGSSSSYIDPSATTPGQYDMQTSVNAASDAQTLFIAQFRAAIGSFGGYRFPNIGVNLRRSPEKAADIIALTIPAKILPTNAPTPWYPPGSIEQFGVGYTEFCDVDAWWLAFNLMPARPYRVAVIDDPTNPWVLDAASSTLTAAVTAAATSLPITTASGPLLSTSGSDYPREINLDGEQVRFTAVGTVITAVDGTFETGIAGWGAPSAATFAQDATQHHSGTKSGKLTATGGQPLAYVRADLLTGVSAGAQVSIVMWALSVPGVANFMVSIDWRDANNSYLSTNSTTVTLAANTWTQVTLNATAPASAAFGGYGPTLGGTPSAGVAVFVDDITAAAVNYQIATAVRGANGVVKPHNAGIPIKLYRPAVIAL